MDEPEEISTPVTTQSRYAIAYHNYAATAPPTVTDDKAHRYDVNSKWYKPDGPGLWLLVDSTEGAAVWEQIQLADSSFHTLFDHFTDATTTTTSEETLYIDQIDAGQLSVNGDKVTAEYVVLAGIHANGENDRLKWKFAGTSIFDSGTFSENSSTCHARITIIRVSNTVVRCAVYFASLSAWEPVYTEITGLDLDATDYDIELLGTAADAAGDVTAKTAHGLFIPAATTNTDWLTYLGEALTYGGEPLTYTE